MKNFLTKQFDRSRPQDSLKEFKEIIKELDAVLNEKTTTVLEGVEKILFTDAEKNALQSGQSVPFEEET
jgi:hypothetical protein